VIAVANRLVEAELLMLRALQIDEKSVGSDHPSVARELNNLAALLLRTNRPAEAEPLMRRMVEIFVHFSRNTGHKHPHLMDALNNYGTVRIAMGDTREQAVEKIFAMVAE